MLQSRRQRIGGVDHAGDSANLRNSLRWAYLPLSVAILAVVAATDVTPAVLTVVVGNGGMRCRALSACESFRRRAAALGACHYVSFAANVPACCTKGQCTQRL